MHQTLYCFFVTFYALLQKYDWILTSGGVVFAVDNVHFYNRFRWCIYNVGEDPLAVLRWSLVRVFFRACFAFVDAGRQHRKISAGNCMFTIYWIVYSNDVLYVNLFCCWKCQLCTFSFWDMFWQLFCSSVMDLCDIFSQRDFVCRVLCYSERTLFVQNKW